MQVSQKEGKVIQQAIEHWRSSDLISEEQYHKLSDSYQVSVFDWKKLAQNSFWLALACIFISVFSALADEWLMGLFKRIFTAPDSIKCLFFSVLAAVCYWLGIRRRKLKPENIFSNEALFFLGIAATASAILFLGNVIDSGNGHYSVLLLIAAVIYGVLGLWFPSMLVWLFSLLSLGSWFGAETGYASGWGAYYLGMNYPLRFVLFGCALVIGCSLLFTAWKARADFLRPTRSIGLLYLFVALWILSIFGNYGDVDSWEQIRQIELIQWSVLFAAASLMVIYHGLKFDDQVTKGFGLTFLFINLYTRYFEYFWDSMNKAIFFALLALSFWYLGTRAEKIWQLSLVRQLTGKNCD